MNHDRGEVCLCVTEHRPEPLDGEWHHVWPLGMGGPDVALNRVYICPTTHTNAHEILAIMVKRKRVVTWQETLDLFTMPVSRYAYRLALLGYRRWQAGAVVA